MNVALPAIIVFLLLIPGLIYLRVRPLDTSQRQLPPAPVPFSIEWVIVVIAAVLLNLVWYVFIWTIAPITLGVVPQPATPIVLMSGKGSVTDEGYSNAVAAVVNYPMYVAVYFLGLYAFATLIACAIGRRLDPLFVQLGLSPDHQSRIADWQRFFESGDNTVTIVSAVTEMGGAAYLIVGRLEELFFEPSSTDLDRIVLADVWRRPIARDPDPATPDNDNGTDSEQALRATGWHKIQGDYFVIQYRDIRNLLVRYYEPP